MSKAKPRVALVERVLTHYRVDAYSACRESLARDGIDFSLIYGQPDDIEAQKQDTTDAPWGHRIRNAYLPFGLVYQPCWNAVRGCDLIIVEYARRLVVNYLLLIDRRFRRYRLAFNGHGFGQQSTRAAPRGTKRLYANAADWWFPYTEAIAATLVDGGFRRDRITVLNNAVDTRKLRSAAEAIPADDVAALRRQLGADGGTMGIFCGSLYHEKGIAFILEACARIKSKRADFQMVFIGDGPDAALVRDAAGRHDWIHYPGAAFGSEKARYLRAADVFLMPSAVGLAILDCFAVGLPLLTTRAPNHGPEIAYLTENVNGVSSAFDVDQFANMVVRVLADRAWLERLRLGSAESAAQYSLENMVESFCNGIKTCLASR